MFIFILQRKGVIIQPQPLTLVIVRYIRFDRWGWHKGLTLEVDQNTLKINVNKDGTWYVFLLKIEVINCMTKRVIGFTSHNS